MRRSGQHDSDALTHGAQQRTARTGVDDAEFPRSISLLICDDHALLTQALTLSIADHDRIRSVAEPVATAVAAIALCEEEHPDVVLMDVDLGPDADGLEATKTIRKVSPETKVIVMTGDASDELQLRAIEAGADGVIHKSQRVERLVEAVEAVAGGRVLFDAAEISRLVRRQAAERERRAETNRRLERLTQREREVLALLREGLTNERIASRLVISQRTTETHVQNILRKLEVHSKLEAVALAAKRDALGA